MTKIVLAAVASAAAISTADAAEWTRLRVDARAAPAPYHRGVCGRDLVCAPARYWTYTYATPIYWEVQPRNFVDVYVYPTRWSRW